MPQTLGLGGGGEGELQVAWELLGSFLDSFGALALKSISSLVFDFSLALKICETERNGRVEPKIYFCTV